MSCVIDTKDKQVLAMHVLSVSLCVLKGVYDRRKTKKTDGGLNDEAQCDQRDTSITSWCRQGQT